MLPRLFNLCRVAQGMAALLSLGLPAAGDLRAEVIRDHLMKLCLLLPRALGAAPLPLPADPACLPGSRGLPADGNPAGWDSPLAPLATRIAAAFAPGEACRCVAAPSPAAGRRRLREFRRRTAGGPSRPEGHRGRPWSRAALAVLRAGRRSGRRASGPPSGPNCRQWHRLRPGGAGSLRPADRAGRRDRHRPSPPHADRSPSRPRRRADRRACRPALGEARPCAAGGGAARSLHPCHHRRGAACMR